MCRNIKPLFNFSPPATDEEIGEAALQFVRKISGISKQSSVNAPAFDLAVDEITGSAKKLFNRLVTGSKPKNRKLEAEKARARVVKRYGTN